LLPPRQAGPRQLKCDAPRMGMLKRVMCARPSGDPTNRSGEALSLPGMRGGGHDGGDHSIVLGEVVGGGVSGVDCPLLYRRRSYTTIAGCQG
jgi:hypothetical protein